MLTNLGSVNFDFINKADIDIDTKLKLFIRNINQVIASSFHEKSKLIDTGRSGKQSYWFADNLRKMCETLELLIH